MRATNFSRARYCTSRPQAMNWHADDRNGMLYRCSCARGFRLPDGSTGPMGTMNRKARGAMRKRAYGPEEYRRKKYMTLHYGRVSRGYTDVDEMMRDMLK